MSNTAAKSAPSGSHLDREATPEELAAIQDVTVVRDTVAFAKADWELVADDFDEAVFTGYEGGRDGSDGWRLTFPDLASYRESWLKQARQMRAELSEAQIVEQIRGACGLAEVRVNGNRALARKQFDGWAGDQRLLWQTYYFLRNDGGRWRITGFVGYLPHEPAR